MTCEPHSDRNDRIIKAVRPQQYDPAGDDGQGTCYLYDGSDRIVRITGPDGTVLQEQAYDSAGNIRTRLQRQKLIIPKMYRFLIMMPL